MMNIDRATDEMNQFEEIPDLLRFVRDKLLEYAEVATHSNPERDDEMSDLAQATISNGYERYKVLRRNVIPPNGYHILEDEDRCRTEYVLNLGLRLEM